MNDPPRNGRPLFRLEIQPAPVDAPEGAREGWVFLAQAGPGLVRIGRARNAPRGAARDWKPNVIAYARVPDRFEAVQRLTQAMIGQRVVGTHLFRISYEAAMTLMREHFGEVVVVPQAAQ